MIKLALLGLLSVPGLVYLVCIALCPLIPFVYLFWSLFNG